MLQFNNPFLSVSVWTHFVFVGPSRVYQMSKLYVYSPSSGLYTCPLAMTDGAAKVIQVGYFRFCDFLRLISHIQDISEDKTTCNLIT